MKNKLIAMLSLLFAGVAFSQPEAMPALVCSGVTTSTVAVTATSQSVSAYLDAIQISVTPSATTCTVSIATTGGSLSARTLYSSATCNGTVILRPMASGTTNTAGVVSYVKDLLASEGLTVSASTATEVTNITVTVKAVIDRMP